jgi:hypothetical protein
MVLNGRRGERPGRLNGGSLAASTRRRLLNPSRDQALVGTSSDE